MAPKIDNDVGQLKFWNAQMGLQIACSKTQPGNSYPDVLDKF